MKQAIETIQDGNNTIHIFSDDNPESPREWDNLGTMVCFHQRYNLGDKDHDFRSWDDLNDYFKDNPSIVVFICAYEHGGITISPYVPSETTLGYPFCDRFDSGWLGCVFVTLEDIRKEFGWKYVTGKRGKKIKQYLVSEIETYDMHLTGDVYGYEVVCNTCNELLDSCWGFYGHDHEKSGLLEYAKGHVCKDCQAIENRLEAVLA